MEISAAKKSLFKKAFDKRSKDEQDNQSASSSFLQNAIKGNQRLNESIDGRKNNSNNLFFKQISHL